jgi:hypothetical protein
MKVKIVSMYAISSTFVPCLWDDRLLSFLTLIVAPEKGVLWTPLMDIELRPTPYILLRISKIWCESLIRNLQADMVLHIGVIFVFFTHVNVRTMPRSALSSPFHVDAMIDSRVSGEPCLEARDCVRELGEVMLSE